MTTKAYGAQSAAEPIAPLTIERRELRPKDILIDIMYCGVCHSDVHNARNEWGRTVYPVVPGHEIVGKVSAVGPEVTRFKAGDMAGIGCLVDSCRECENCLTGLQQFCLKGFVGTYGGRDKQTGEVTYGGYSKDIVVDEDFALHITHTDSIEKVAPLLCAGITTYSPLRHWNVGKGTAVAVVGLGGLGHMAVKLAASFGAEVTVLSTSPSKEKDAQALGAHHFALTTDPETMKGLVGTFDFILDAVSAEHDYNQYLQMLKADGKMVCVGAPATPMSLSVFSLLGGRKTLAGSLIGGIPETQEMLDYCAKNNILPDVEMIRMDQINEAYDRMVKGDVRYRFVIDMSTL